MARLLKMELEARLPGALVGPGRTRVEYFIPGSVRQVCGGWHFRVLSSNLCRPCDPDHADMYLLLYKYMRIEYMYIINIAAEEDWSVGRQVPRHLSIVMISMTSRDYSATWGRSAVGWEGLRCLCCGCQTARQTRPSCSLSQDTDTFLILGSAAILTRKWCVGEMVTVAQLQVMASDTLSKHMQTHPETRTCSCMQGQSSTRYIESQTNCTEHWGSHYRRIKNKQTSSLQMHNSTRTRM